MPFFSVIVPIYNVASHFSKGLACLLLQKFKDFEVILVDDGSTDDSSRLCDEASVSYSNIKVIHQSNNGVGNARNRGIDESKGEYICFFDIDDSVSIYWLLCIKFHIERTRPQMLIYGYTETNLKHNTINTYVFKPFECHTNEELKDIYVEHLSGMKFNNGFVWNKVYSREFLVNNAFRFPDLRIQQDEVFNLNIYLKAKHVSVIEDVLYDYYVYYKGNTRSSYIIERFEIFCEVKRAFFELLRRWKLEDKKFEDYVHRRFLNNIIYNMVVDTYRQRHIYLQRVFASLEVEDSVHFLRTYNTCERGFFFINYLQAFEKKSECWYCLTKMTESTISLVKKIVRSFIKGNNSSMKVKSGCCLR